MNLGGVSIRQFVCDLYNVFVYYVYALAERVSQALPQSPVYTERLSTTAPMHGKRYYNASCAYIGQFVYKPYDVYNVYASAPVRPGRLSKASAR